MLSAFSSYSSSSSITHQAKYDVFLSFRGEDTRDNFTSHVYAALCRKQIETFMDNQLIRGDEISTSLLKAIEGSLISVIIFSKGYASSRWCLDELVKILECKSVYGQIVIPVFYHVNPSDVRRQDGTFANAFAEHEQRFKERLDMLQKWRAALEEAANLSGWNSHVIKPESLLIEKLVEDILKRLNDMSPNDDNGLVGVNSIMREIELLLCNGTKHFCMVGIWGIGGIGKTTVAGALLNKVFHQFEGSYFIQNVREESEKHGLIRWQQELLSSILGDKGLNIGTYEARSDTFAFAKKRLGRKKVLIVFDDVSDPKQIEIFIKDPHLFYSGSRIIITTRDKHVLTICGVDPNKIYKLEGLFYDEALKLFNLHAFGKNHPAVGYEELSNKLVRYANGVPLALKVLGSFLRGRSKQKWESAMHKLERVPHKDIYDVLKISYNGLDDEQQNIFLDIACFFKGEDKDLVRNILDANGLSAEINLSILIDKSLITISGNTIAMHDLLQEMGQEIVRQESKHPNKRSRLWYHEDIFNVLTKNRGSEAIEGISLDLSKSRDIHLKPDAFALMDNLKLFKLHNSSYEETHNKIHDFQGVESQLTELIYLHWHGYPFKYLLSNFHLENIVVLHLSHSNVEQLWNGVQKFANLKHINLSHSRLLTRSPNFSVAPNLESLTLEGCTNLLELSSIEHLSELVVLNLRECKSLTSIPTTSHLKCLRTLVLSGCSNLNTCSEMSCDVEELFLDGTVIEELPSSSIEYLSRLVMLNLNNCTRLKSLPSNICKLKSLEYLYLSGCSKLESLPNDLRGLEALKELKVEGTAITEVPSSVAYLSNLRSLSFEGCKGQESLGLILPSKLLGKLHKLRFLTLSDCGITELPESLSQLSSLVILELAKNDFQTIPTSILRLSNLTHLDISYCERLESLPTLPWDADIEANGCTELQALSGFSIRLKNNSRSTHIVNFINCFKLDREALSALIEEALLKFQLIANVWWENDKKAYHLRISSMSYPGSEIPEWFSFQSEDSFITLELQPGWFNSNFVGFAVCVVIAFRGYHDDGLAFGITCECKFKCQNEHWHEAAGYLHGWSDDCHGPQYIRSDHIFLGYDFLMCPDDCNSHCSYNEVSIEFYPENFLDRPVECCEVTKCGVRLMYAQDSGEPSGRFSPDEDEFGDSIENPSGRLSSDKEDHFLDLKEEPSGSPMATPMIRTVTMQKKNARPLDERNLHPTVTVFGKQKKIRKVGDRLNK